MLISSGMGGGITAERAHPGEGSAADSEMLQAMRTRRSCHGKSILVIDSDHALVSASCS